MKKLYARLNVFGLYVSDRVADFGGSWTFIFLFLGFSGLYMIYNSYVKSPFDPFPFAFLNLALGFIASLQAPFIMMSSNRQAEKDRKQAEIDLAVDTETDILVKQLAKDMIELKELFKSK